MHVHLLKKIGAEKLSDSSDKREKKKRKRPWRTGTRGREQQWATPAVDLLCDVVDLLSDAVALLCDEVLRGCEEKGDGSRQQLQAAG